MFALKDQNAWFKYVRDEITRTRFGISVEAYKMYRLRGPQTERVVQSMLSAFEIGLLYALAKDHWGGGAIVDAGPLLGASTFALAKGVRENASVPESMKREVIYSFDLWARRGYERFLTAASGNNATGSLFPDFLRTVSEFTDLVVPHQGDFKSWIWDGRPIDIIFMDLAKDWKLNEHYVRTMLPYLVPDHGVLVQQDYVHFNEYWIHITMEHFAEAFEFCGVVAGATAFFRLQRPLTETECGMDFFALPFSRKWELLEAARAKMPLGVQQVMKSAAAKCAIEHGELSLAKRLLESIDVRKFSDDPVIQFHGTAASNKQIVEGMLLQRERCAS